MRTLRRFGSYLSVLVLLVAVATACTPAPAPAPTAAPAGGQPAAAAPAKFQGVLGAIPKEVLDGTAKMPQFSGEYVIGTMYPRTGANAYLGEDSWRGAELAARVQNYKGGINGKEIKLDLVDTPDTAAGVSATERFINQKGYKLLMGTYASAISVATSEIAEKNNVFYWETNGTADTLTQRGLKYYYRTNSRTSSLSKGAVDLIKNGLPAKFNMQASQIKVAIANEDGEYGTQGAQFAEQWLKEAGIQLVAKEAYSAKSVDLSSMILKLKAANPDVVIGVGLGPDVILFWKQSRELDFNPKAVIGLGAGYTAGDFYKALGSAAEGVMSSDFPVWDMPESAAPGMQDYAKLYRATYKEEMHGPHTLNVYIGASALWEVIKAAGGINDPEALRKAANALDIPWGQTMNGWGVKFGAEGTPDAHTNIYTRIHVMQWQPGGKFSTIWPKEAASVEMIAPLPKWSERK